MDKHMAIQSQRVLTERPVITIKRAILALLGKRRGKDPSSNVTETALTPDPQHKIDNAKLNHSTNQMVNDGITPILQI